MMSGLVNKHRSSLFLFTSLSWQNHTDLVRTKDVQVKRKVLIWLSGFSYKFTSRFRAQPMNGNQCNVL